MEDNKTPKSIGFASKQKWLDLAEIIDAHRIIPRLLLLAVSCLVGYTMLWFFGIHMTPVIACDPTLIQILLDHGQNIDLARELACKTTAYVGGPTTQHVTFATAIVGGLASAVFGFYANTGRNWKQKDD